MCRHLRQRWTVSAGRCGAADHSHRWVNGRRNKSLIKSVPIVPEVPSVQAVGMIEPWNDWNNLNGWNKAGEVMERFELSQELGREILDMANEKGASQGDAVMVESDSFFVTVRMGEVEKISEAGEKSL